MISLYTESTPNPDTLKFVANRMIYAEGSIEIKSTEEANEIPLAKALFESFDFVKTIFIAKNFITVTKATEDEWFEISIPVKEMIKVWLEEGKETFSESFIAPKAEVQLDVPIEEDDVEGKIKAILDKYVRPGVEQDGGNIAFKSFHEGVVSLEMQGACSGCPSASMTLKNGVELLLKKFVPEVKEVISTEEEVK